jgi:ribonuclease HI
LENLKEPCRVHLLTDSNYVVQTMLGRFKRKANHDWWARLDAAARRHQVSWEWIKGHSGHAVQEVADDTARRIAQAGRVDADLLDEAALQLTGK